MDEPTQSVERERKFDVATEHVVPSLLGIAGIAGVVDGGEYELVAEYFDTADLSLATSGRALRYRTGGHDAGWHVKELTPDGVRETQWATTQEAGGRIPEQVSAFVREFCDDLPLQLIARVTTMRQSLLLLRDENAHPVAELANDLVSTLDVRSETSRTWREWEIEVLTELSQKQAEAFLDDVQSALVAAGAVASNVHSKLQRALGLE